MSFLKAENIKLKARVQELEDRIMNLAGSVRIFSSGMSGREHEMNNQIAEIITNATELKIVAPYVTQEYALILEDLAKNGMEIQLVINDRRFWPQEYVQFYDKLKNTPGINLINNPNVKYLLIWSPTRALISSGPLDKTTLMKTVLIGTLVQEKAKVSELLNIFKEMLPSFMR